MSPTDWRFWSALFAAMMFLGHSAAAADQCDSPQDPEAAIIDCTRSINSGKWKGRYLAAFYSNRAAAYQQYQDDLAQYQKDQTDEARTTKAQEPRWREWNVPTLREPCIQANANVVKLEASQASTYDHWLTISTLEKGQPIAVPVKLAPYHKEALTDPKTGQTRKLNSSVQLNKRDGVWWLTLSYDEEVTQETVAGAPVVGIDVGIANFVTTSTGKQYGSFHKALRARHKRDRAKRRRKAKLRVRRIGSDSFCCRHSAAHARAVVPRKTDVNPAQGRRTQASPRRQS